MSYFERRSLFTKKELELWEKREKLFKELGRLFIASGLATMDEFLKTPHAIELCQMIDKVTKELYDLAVSLGRKEEYERRIKRRKKRE